MIICLLSPTFVQLFGTGGTKFARPAAGQAPVSSVKRNALRSALQKIMHYVAACVLACVTCCALWFALLIVMPDVTHDAVRFRERC